MREQPELPCLKKLYQHCLTSDDSNKRLNIFKEQECTSSRAW